jgi:hypothetical protein
MATSWFRSAGAGQKTSSIVRVFGAPEEEVLEEADDIEEIIEVDELEEIIEELAEVDELEEVDELDEPAR